MLKYLLDTDICIYTLRNKPAAVRAAFTRYSGQFAISSITLMELIYGAEKSAQPASNLQVIEGFTARMAVLNYDAQAAMHTGQVRATLAQKGTPIGSYDMMIAGHARACGLTLVTNNQREFSRVPGLMLDNWALAAESVR